MYQTLICWIARLDRRRDQPCRFAPPLDTELFQRTANALVHRMWTDAQADRDFLAAVVLVHEQEAVDLSLAQARNAQRGIIHVSFSFSLAGRHPPHHSSFRAWNDAQTHSLGLV
jgi:hypothetical protein